ncbi:hypothetical protein ACFC09_25165 [Streptomyces sp. NPDC056161]|uniref:hypothetical protein n=1 Tax=Streptomyces sp. NPDC056161 TaxID=3345732 RepID=UPI0035DB5152
MCRGTRSDEADREALERALGVAGRHGLGEHVMTQGLGGRTTGLGCVAASVALVLLLPGIGLLAGPYGGPAKAVAVALVVPAIALPVVAIRVEGRLAHRDTRLHVFDGGSSSPGPGAPYRAAGRTSGSTSVSNTAPTAVRDTASPRTGCTCPRTAPPCAG